MARRVPLIAAIAAVVMLYAGASLWPYKWQEKGWVANAAAPMPEGGVRFPGPGIAIAKRTPTWIEPAMRSHRLELELWVRPSVSEQFGPARIITLSLDNYKRNLTIGQESADLILRLRTAWTNANGAINGEPVVRVPRLFLTEDWVDLRVRIEPGVLCVTVGDEVLVDEALPARPLETWDPSYQLALGNELTGTRPWLGEIRRAIVRAGGRAENYAETGNLEIPPRFLITWQSPEFVPLRNLKVSDAVKNVIFYVPMGLVLGALLGTWNRGRFWCLVLGVILFMAVLSVTMEGLQIFLPRRWPSINDVIFNILGGTLGLFFALWATQWLRAARRTP